MVTSEIHWLLYILSDLHIYQEQAVPLTCDSKSALHIAKNLVFHDRTKHIKLDYHIVRERYLAGILKPLSVSFIKQLADVFTKPLGIAPFKSLIE